MANEITNRLFVWGNATAQSSDLAAISEADEDSQSRVAPGAKGGELVYSNLLNAGLRDATLLSFCFGEALKAGPDTNPAYPTANAWLTEETWTKPLDLSYDAFDGNVPGIAEALSYTLRRFVKYSEAAYAKEAGKWHNAVTLQLRSGTYVGTAKTIQGGETSTVYLYLPSTITSNTTGSAAKAKTTYEYSTDSSFYPVIVSNSTTESNSDLKFCVKFQFNPSTGEFYTNKLNARMQYGNFFECDTAAGTAAKLAGYGDTGFTSLIKGEHVYVRFENANSANNPTLRVGVSDAKPIKWKGSATVGADAWTSWTAGEIVEFVYDDADNGAWIIANHPDWVANANYATSAGRAAYLGSAQVGGFNTPIYLNGDGQATAGGRFKYAEVLNFSIDYAEDTGIPYRTSNPPNFNHTITGCNGIAKAFQRTASRWEIEADLAISYSIRTKTWFRLDLTDLTNSVFDTFPTIDFSNVAANSVSIIVTPNKPVLTGDVPAFVAIANKRSGNIYVYIGTSDIGEDADYYTEGFSVRISWKADIS